MGGLYGGGGGGGGAKNISSPPSHPSSYTYENDMQMIMAKFSPHECQL